MPHGEKLLRVDTVALKWVNDEVKRRNRGSLLRHTQASVIGDLIEAYVDAQRARKGSEGK